MDIQLPYGFIPRDYQKPIWDAIVHNGYTRAITVWPRRNGKDLTAINIVTTKAMQRKGLYLYIAPFSTQVRSIIWKGSDGAGKRFLDYIPKQLVAKKNEAEMSIELVNGSVIRLCGSDNIDSIVGNNPIGIVFTEFSLQKDGVWDFLRPILAENGGWALFNGTPRGLNHFYKLFKAAAGDEKWFTQIVTQADTGIPSLEAIEEDRTSGMPESLIQQEYYCSWTSSSENVLIPLDLLEPAVNRQVDEDYLATQPRVMGVDVAFAEKGDKAVIARRQGTLLHPLDKYQGVDNMALATQVAHRIKSWNPHAVFIDAGRGEGVISRLHQLGYQSVVYPVNFGGKTYSDLYNRKKDEMYGRCKDWLSDKVHLASIPHDEALLRDLSAPTFIVNDKGFIQIESKIQLRKRGYSSTDEGDGVVLTFAEELPELPSARSFRERRAMAENNLSGTQEYDPLSYVSSLTNDPLIPDINQAQTQYDLDWDQLHGQGVSPI